MKINGSMIAPTGINRTISFLVHSTTINCYLRSSGSLMGKHLTGPVAPMGGMTTIAWRMETCTTGKCGTAIYHGALARNRAWTRAPREFHFCTMLKIWAASVVNLVCMHHLSTRRSEEHTSELQSRQYLVCRLL